MRPLLITGVPGVGKTTLVQGLRRAVAERLPHVAVSGFVTEEERPHGQRTGFRIVTFPAGETATLASVAVKEGPSVGKYRVDLPGFERVALPLLRSALASGSTAPRLLIVDEIGKMEMFSSEFERLMESVLSNTDPALSLICTVALRGPGLIARAKSMRGVEVVEITRANRDDVLLTLTRRLLEGLPARIPLQVGAEQGSVERSGGGRQTG
eukprot:Hpha_TRINITY_DN16092_c0_g2::TRINITY_DN16092_c0_g2_i1::g.117459::m.117459/K06928/NTPCR; nucleoside-triphosphatase